MRAQGLKFVAKPGASSSTPEILAPYTSHFDQFVFGNLRTHHRRTLRLRSLHDGQEPGNLREAIVWLCTQFGRSGFKKSTFRGYSEPGFAMDTSLGMKSPSGAISTLPQSLKTRWSAWRLLPTRLRQSHQLIDRDLIAYIRKGQEPNGSVHGVLDAMGTSDRIEQSVSI